MVQGEALRKREISTAGAIGDKLRSEDSEFSAWGVGSRYSPTYYYYYYCVGPAIVAIALQSTDLVDRSNLILQSIDSSKPARCRLRTCLIGPTCCRGVVYLRSSM